MLSFDLNIAVPSLSVIGLKRPLSWPRRSGASAESEVTLFSGMRAGLEKKFVTKKMKEHCTTDRMFSMLMEKMVCFLPLAKCSDSTICSLVADATSTTGGFPLSCITVRRKTRNLSDIAIFVATLTCSHCWQNQYFIHSCTVNADANRSRVHGHDFSKRRKGTTHNAIYERIFNKYFHGKLVHNANQYSYYQICIL